MRSKSPPEVRPGMHEWRLIDMFRVNPRYYLLLGALAQGHKAAMLRSDLIMYATVKLHMPRAAETVAQLVRLGLAESCKDNGTIWLTALGAIAQRDLGSPNWPAFVRVPEIFRSTKV